MKHECIGRVVTSKAGRDKGRTFLIVGLCDENYVYLADGETRKLAAPKMTKRTHLRRAPGTPDRGAAQRAAGGEGA